MISYLMIMFEELMTFESKLLHRAWHLSLCRKKQLGILSGFPDYGFPAYFCHFKHVIHRKLLLFQIAFKKWKKCPCKFLEHDLSVTIDTLLIALSNKHATQIIVWCRLVSRWAPHDQGPSMIKERIVGPVLDGNLYKLIVIWASFW